MQLSALRSGPNLCGQELLILSLWGFLSVRMLQFLLCGAILLHVPRNTE
ncbi:hypothetical protein HMPREF9104_02502 [Lentilactobacillus kisonensis F0435]|uniref:Uncharacterized protein n=1 Tax=Lentilactobacillus kisonensis F0435 TaxID=797516 RepID=H1LIR1_9LACO|nr:hypothetical protein HMPREF9104_02502 [Lentilactobacillus kisonensis F0435]